MIGMTLYIAIGLVLAFDAGTNAGAERGFAWHADFTGFVVVTLFWGPIVAWVVARAIGDRL